VPRRILIIDDDPDQVATLAELLRLEGHHVEVTTNPLYAMNLARSFQPELAFIDIGLPYMDGHEAVRRLKRHFPQARMFAITGRSGEEEVRKSLEAGFEAHLVKPIDFRAIERLIG
jgi:CheY-like chemotaxis protein